MFEDTLETLKDEIAQGVPMVVPEPSCGASFRDELVEMLPHDQQAQRLSKQTYTLAEFLTKFAPDFEIPQADRTLLVQKHCHHQSVMGFDADEKVLNSVASDVQIPSSGCCGLAGSWGFEKEKFDISMDCGERVLFPAVRDAAPGDVLVADGFSCRTQIEQGTGRRAIHLAQLIKAALPDGPELPPERPEQAFEDTPNGSSSVKQGMVLAAFAAGAVAAAGAAARRRAHQ
jgi:Fe-S oxidoreductase